MKKLINICILSFAVIIANAQAQPAGCCPKFSLSTNLIYPCDDNACKGNPADPNGGAGGSGQSLIACKNQPQTYYVVPALLGFTYTWTILGGTPTNTTGNTVTINWGNANQGFLQVIIKNADSSCRDTITRKICLLDGPTAAISYSPNPICALTDVYFNGAGSVGATNYYWDFGDGTYSTLQNPLPHQFSSGTHTIVLTVSNVVTDTNGNKRDCGCKDTAKVTINVQNKKGIDIYTDDCRKMLCTGDIVKYCTSSGCSGLTWTVNGGTIISGQGTSCISVAWNQPSVYPTSITLTATSCPGSICGNTATMNVPVLYPNLPIQGPQIVCPGSNTSYSLPALPGTFYYWMLSSGGTIAGYDSNHNVINITWGSLAGGPHKLVCRYTNPYSGCSGADTIDINIKPKFTLFGLSPVCVGQVTSICANGPVSTWTHLPNSGFTINFTNSNCENITWNLAGNYAVTATPVTATSFCSSPALLNVVVLDTPKINPIVGPLVVCPGQTVMYSATSNMNAGTFNWSVTNGTIIQTMGTHNDSVLVQFTASGTISVSQTVNNCSSYLQVVNVSVITSIGTITGNSPTCIDAIEIYTIAGPVPPGGYTWTLSNSLGAIINTAANSITVQWNGAGPSATCTITATACSQTATKVVTVNNPPNGTITTTGNLCTTGVTLTTSLAMPSHDWYRNGVFYINSGASTSITVITPGFYKVKSPVPCYGTASVYVPNTFTSSVSVSADNVTSYCTGSTINFNLIATVQSNNTCTYSYQWYNGATPVGTNSPSYNVTGPGSYSVVISCGNCKDTSNIINVTVAPCPPDCTGILDPSKVIGNDIGGPAAYELEPVGDALFAYSININSPVASPCNVVTFSANYNFTSPNSPNSGVYWNFGDGYGATSSWAGMSGTSTAAPHTYTTPGIYVVSALMYSNCPTPPPAHICPVLDTIHYVVPVAANFGFNVNCNIITLSDLSTTLPSLGCNISAWAWSVTGPAGATFNNPAAQNPVLTVTQSGVYNIILLVTSNCGGCQASVTYPVTITLPSATFTAPSPICALTAAPFSVTNTPGFSYNWNFGDGYQSNMASTNHGFAPPLPNTSLVTLIVTDVMGCTATSSQTVTILPPLTVSIPTDKFICPGTGFTLSTTPAVFTNYQWYFNGNPISGATNPTYNATNVGEYYVIVNNGTGCVAKSNKMHIWHYPKPIADIKGQTIQCINGGTGNLYLYNSVNDPNSTYFWSVTPAATFSPNNTQYDANVTVNATGTYQFILTVTDNVTGCIAKDTFCVYVYNSPSVSIAPTGYLCEGITHTYTANATPPNPNYVYQWNNGVTGISMSTAQAGNYYVTVLDPATGCNAQSNWVTIKPRPYVALFPIGCDTLCDTVKLIPPLPLAPGQTYGSVYVIKWYVDGNYNSTGPVLNLNLLSLGQHQINIVVNFIGDSCAAVSGKYDLFIKHCGDCDCKESHWGETQIAEGDIAAAKNNKAIIGQGGNPITLNCGTNKKIDCNKTYTVSSSYNCKDTACTGKVTFSLQPPTGSPITGTGTITFTTSQTGTYVLTMYGWCGDKKCDSCIIKFDVHCDPLCDCKGSKWGEKTYAAENVTKLINCDKNKTITVKCKKPVTINATYNCADVTCNAAVTYTIQPPAGLPTNGSLPLTFTPNQTGTYTVTIYGWCGNKLCDSCVVKFKTECDSVPEACCPYEIKAETGTVKYDYVQIPGATLASQTFIINGLALANITEVRANIVSYTITDNFGKECMKCVNLPFTWASIASAANIGAVTPKITMYGGTTVLSFTGSGAGAYQNPREVIWNNGSPISIPNNTGIGMNFILPPVPAIDCCELKGRICVKFTFRDNDCKECEVIACFDFLIKKK